MKIYSMDWSQIAILSWGARATGMNLDWCLTPDIKQKATSVCLCIPLMYGKEPERKGGKKYFSSKNS
jgi:hypothetical protein